MSTAQKTFRSWMKNWAIRNAPTSVSTADVRNPRLMGAMALESLSRAFTRKMPTTEVRMPMPATMSG